VEPSPSTLNWTPRGGLKAFVGAGPFGILLIVLAALYPRDRTATDVTDTGPRTKGEIMAGIIRHPVGRFVVAAIGAVLLLLALQYLYAGLRRQILVSFRGNGVEAWRFGRMHHTRWADVVALSSYNYRTHSVRVVRRRGPTLTVPTWGVPDGAAFVRAELLLWLRHERPDDWHRIPGVLRSNSARPSPAGPTIDW
jgi:hypothetical protein